MPTLPQHTTSDQAIAKATQWLVWLAVANLVVMVVLAATMILMLLPKLERAVATTERVEQRFQEFADEIQPVMNASANKAIEAIRKIDADRLSETATESSDATIREFGERAKRYLNRDKPDDTREP